ncbi:MAG: winged helix-turn-helix transcriptional regulator [Solirubrobacteraceae bacterium]
MLRNDYENQSCSIAGALEVVGERWSLLLVRDILLGLRRFDELQSQLGIARNVLQARLARLQEHGVLERVPYQQRPLRHEYLLTEKGLDLWPTIVALMNWGDRYAPPEGGPAVILAHRGCGGSVDAHRICKKCGARLKARDAVGLAGPGASPDHPLSRRAREAAQA